MELYLVARQWEVPRLEALTERQIKIRLSLGTVLPLLRAASLDGVRSRPIQDACKQFFLANYQDQPFEDGWSSLDQIAPNLPLRKRPVPDILRIDDLREAFDGSQSLARG
ncbi:hypothetical protein AK812_SmicGene32790 [Symbiodinium microadriaticum]|uniref:Uncharacterized protein n=1 Tax=Symbiodinium microadriaticum TaxID=2951 RepID=A0A1Q9CT90_SYMMI|nr:hypothetical protein AK812_SmicGene32790 [Symbiodinium microadriaticum]